MNRAMVVTALLVAGFSTSTVVLGLKLHAAEDLAQDRQAAAGAASAAVKDVLTYDYRTLDADLARGGQGLTPLFRQQYGQVVTTTVRPRAVEEHVVTRATVPAVSVVSASRNSVRVLMFVDQTTTSTKQANVVGISRVQVTMTPSGGRWLVADLRAI